MQIINTELNYHQLKCQTSIEKVHNFIYVRLLKNKIHNTNFIFNYYDRKKIIPDIHYVSSF